LKKERYFVLFLALLIALAGVIIVPLDHDVDQDGHLKDEEGFYSWAELYNDGYYSLPIEEAKGEYNYKQSFSTDPRVSEIVLDTQIKALDGNGIADDLYVKLEWKNGTPLSDARLKVFTKAGKSRTNWTDEAGEALLKDLPFGPRPVEILVPSTPPIIFHETIEVQGNRVVYGIYSETEVEVLTSNTLENLTVTLLNDNGTPADGLAVLFLEREVGISDTKGQVKLWGMDVKYAKFRIGKPITTANGRLVYEDAPDIKVVFQGQDRPVKEPKGTFDCSVNDTVRLDIVVLDTFKRPVGYVDVTLDGRALGQTDTQGLLSLEEEMDDKEHVLDLHKKVDGYEVPLASGVGTVDGEPHYVNHWPPGPSVVLSWFMKLGIENLFGLFFFALLAVSTYLLTRRFLGFRFGLIAAVLVMSNSIVIMLLYGQWMGDLSSPAFALFGMFLFVEATELMFKDKKLLPVIFFLASGLCFAAGVSMRYSGIVMCFAPVTYLVLRLVPREKLQLKKVFNVKNLKRSVFAAVPWVIGLLIIGLILASYNSAYFGGPFNSGYQSSRTFFAVSGEEGDTTLETYEAEENFFQRYFNYEEQDVDNFSNIFVFMLCLVPLLFVCIPVVLLIRRPIVAALLVWIIAVFVIYLSQGWVLTNTLGDIRYYLPIVPPAGILATILIREVYKSKAWRKLRTAPTLVVFSVVSLLLLSHGLASAEILEWEYNRFQGQGGRLPQGGGAPPDNGNQPVQAVDVDLTVFNANPDDYLGSTVKLTAEVERILNSNAFIIGTDREFVVLVEGGVNFAVGQRVSIQGLVELDEQKPGEYLIRCKADGVVPVGTDNGNEPSDVIVVDLAVFNATPEDFLNKVVQLEAVVTRILNSNAFVIGTEREFVVQVEGGVNVSIGQKVSIQGRVDVDDKKPGEYMLRSRAGDVTPVEDGTRAVQNFEQALPPKNNNPPPKQKPKGLKPSKQQVRAGTLGVAATLVLIGAGIFCKLRDRIDPEKPTGGSGPSENGRKKGKKERTSRPARKELAQEDENDREGFWGPDE